MNTIDMDSLASLVAYTSAPNLDRNGTATTPQDARQGISGKLERASRNACVMIVDDESVNIDLVQAYLGQEGFGNFVTTTDSTSVIEMARVHKPDIILLDICMPSVTGIDILREMHSDPKLRKTPVVVLTTATEPDTKLQALRLGASDFLNKPVHPVELLLRIENVLNLKAYQNHLTGYSERLEQQIEIRVEEILRSRQEAILCLARAAEYRDDETGQHVTRVGRYSSIIADELGFPKAAVALIEQAAQLHDIGKIGIPDSILNKPGKLESDEFSYMQTHCGIGRRIIGPLTDEESELMRRHASVELTIMSANKSPILKMAAVIAETHHEKWDGSGYPKGLVGKQIPIEGRIVAVADVFDALSSKRPYKEAFPIEKCLGILSEGRGKHFDPRVLDAFMARRDEIVRVRQQGVQVGVDFDANDTVH